MNSSNPLVSVVITTYNRPKLLLRSMKSVYNQEYDNVEVIVVDDKSDYDIKSHLLKNIGSESYNLIVNKSNKGANWSRKKGIEEAEGDFVAFLDDDDLWKKDKLTKQMAVMTSEPTEVGVVTAGIDIINNEYLNNHIPQREFSKEDLIKDFLCCENPIGGFSCVLIRKSAIIEAGYPDENLKKNQDIEWYLRLAKVCEFRAVQEPLVLYDSDPSRERMTDLSVEVQADSYKYIIQKHYDEVADNGVFFKNKVQGMYYYKKAINRFRTGEFKSSRSNAYTAIYHYPFIYKSYMLIIASLFGKYGLTLARRVRYIAGKYF